MDDMTYQLPLSRSRFFILAAVLVALTGLRWLMAHHLELSEDEAYYWLWAKHLQLSYYDHPAGVACFIALGQWLWGPGTFGLRFMAAISWFVSSLLVFDTAARVFDRHTAFWAVMWANATLLMNISGILITPDIPLVLCWAACLWSSVRLIQGENGWWGVAAGAFFGLGFDSKYTMALLAPGLVATFLCHPQTRRLLARPWLCGAFATSLVASAPVWVWNATHHWASFSRQWQHAFNPHQTHAGLKYFTELLGSQALLLTPLVFIFCLMGMVWVTREGLKHNNPAKTLLGLSAWPVLAYFLWHTCQGRVQAHWVGPAYIGGLMTAAAFALHFKNRGGRWRQWLFYVTPALGVVFSGLVYAQTFTPIIPIKPHNSPITRLRGWKSLAYKVAAVQHSYPDTFMLTSDHNLVGELMYYMPGHPLVFQNNQRIRYPFLTDADIARCKGRNALYVIRDKNDNAPAIAPAFKGWQRLPDITVTTRGQVVRRYHVYLGRAYQGGLL